MREVRRTVEAVWRVESPRLIAGLARLVRDVGLAEELAQDAFVAALEQWPERGVPANPGGWLTTTARHKAIDLIRREQTRQARYAELNVDPYAAPADAALADPIRDDRLTMAFIACHPVLSVEARVALTLRLVGGLTTEEIARACLVPPATMGQRISRAKRALAAADVAFEAPQSDELSERLAAVLEVVYLIFNEGYAASSGPSWIRRELADEAMRLGRVLASLLPAEPEVHGLVALMELQASRFAARTGPDGAVVLLEDQDRSRWDRLLIRHGLASLDRAVGLGRPLGAYGLQAAIAAQHARAATWPDTNWSTIAVLYDALALIAPSPVVELNRAVAILMADGPAAALASLDRIAADPRVGRMHLFGAVRGDVLGRLGRHAEAAAELERAATLAPNERERDLLTGRAVRSRLLIASTDGP